MRAHVPFAQAHEAAGKCVAQCESTNRQLHELTDAELSAIHPQLDGGVRAVLTVEGALASRTTIGGTAPSALKAQLTAMETLIASDSKKFASKAEAFSTMMGA